MSVVTRIRTKEELTVPFSPEEVWSVLVDVSAYPIWWPARAEARALGDQPGLLGTQIEVRPLMGRAFCFRLEELDEIRSLRLRFFGGSLEGPGGFHLEPATGGTRVSYEVDVFARGLDIALFSQILPVHWIQASQMRSVLRSLRKQLKVRRRIAARAEVVAKSGTLVETPAQASNLAVARIPALARRVAAWFMESPPDASKASAVTVANTAVSEPTSNFDIARDYLHALSSAAAPADMARFFHEDVTEEEFPNLMLPVGATRDLSAILAARSRAESLWRDQRFELRGATGGGSQVAMEVGWTGSATCRTDAYAAGERAEARLAIFLKFQDQRIVRQRTYVCFAAMGGDGTEADPDVRPTPASSTGEPASASPVPKARDSNFEIARRYLEALSAGADAEAIAQFFAGDAIQEERPDRFIPRGATRSLEAIKRAREKKLAFFDSQHYDLRGATGGGSQVAMEVHWTGTVGLDHDSFVAGQKLEAHSAIFLKFRDGLIVRQRNYESLIPERAHLAGPARAGEM